MSQILSDFSALIAEHGATAFFLGALAFFAGGFVKGAIGFALPLVAVSGATMVLPGSVAVAAIALPAFLMNVWQALRFGWREAWATGVKYRAFLLPLLISVPIFAQLLPSLPPRAFYLILGVGATVFAAAKLSGWDPETPPERRTLVQILGGIVSGFFGGLAAMWGPVTVMTLISLRLEKSEQVRACGVFWGLAALPFLAAHLYSGLLNGATLLLSLLALIPVSIGMRLGQMFQDSLDQKAFLRVTLIVLAVAGLNLIRKGLLTP